MWKNSAASHRCKTGLAHHDFQRTHACTGPILTKPEGTHDEPGFCTPFEGGLSATTSAVSAMRNVRQRPARSASGGTAPEDGPQSRGGVRHSSSARNPRWGHRRTYARCTTLRPTRARACSEPTRLAKVPGRPRGVFRSDQSGTKSISTLFGKEAQPCALPFPSLRRGMGRRSIAAP